MRSVWQPESVTRRMGEITSTALLWGFDAIELRSVGRPEDRIPHVSERLIRTACLEADLPVAVVDPEFFGGLAVEKAAWMNELATLPEVIRFADRIGSPGIIVGSLDGEGPADDALKRILAEAGRLAERAGLGIHVRAGSDERLAGVAEAIRSLGFPSVRPMPEIGLDLSSAAVEVPPEAGEASYVRILYRGRGAVSLDEADALRDLYGRLAARLTERGFKGDVCLEFAERPEPASGLRISTAFVSAMSRT